ncbi:MAG: DUF389 domain-containing protein [Cyanobacteria bacterium P01_H01_bin.15]
MPKVSTKELGRLRAELLADSQFCQTYLVQVICSCLIASLGLLSDSAAVIIGAMLIAPFMLPLRGLAFAALEADVELFRKSLISIVYGTALALFISFSVGWIVSIPALEFGSEMLSRTQPNLVDLAIAITAGGVSAYAKLRSEIRDSLAGTAIAVALMPPVCVTGLALSQGAIIYSWGAFLLYFTNLLGIGFACIVIFARQGYYAEWKKVRWAIWSSLAMTAFLAVPLLTSLYVLLKQDTLSATIKEILLNETVTVGKQTRLIKMTVNWNTHPPEVTLFVQAREPVQPNQVKLVEEFLQKRLGQNYRLIFQVSEFNEVTSDMEIQETATAEPEATTTPRFKLFPIPNQVMPTPVTPTEPEPEQDLEPKPVENPFQLNKPPKEDTPGTEP